ncbi:MAG: magnesium transporter, partial [Actinobacteria bacterium]|nr:magnesium transporter [Actinomycetota bacterium]
MSRLAGMSSPVPGLPHGLSIGKYDTYEQAQRAVDYLSDQRFPVENLAIVGTDLR